MSKLDDLKNKAQQIRTNELPESNTAELVGQTFEIVSDLLGGEAAEEINKAKEEAKKEINDMAPDLRNKVAQLSSKVDEVETDVRGGNSYDETKKNNGRIIQFYHYFKAGTTAKLILVEDHNTTSKGTLYGYRADGTNKALLPLPSIIVGNVYDVNIDEDYLYLHFFNSGGTESYSMRLYIESGKVGLFEEVNLLKNSVKGINVDLDGISYDQTAVNDRPNRVVFEGISFKKGMTVNFTLIRDENIGSKGTLYGFKDDETFDALISLPNILIDKTYQANLLDDYAYIEFWNSAGTLSFEARLQIDYAGYLDKIDKLNNRFSKIKVLDINGNGDFSSFTDAYLNAGDTKEQPVTILVMPGVYITDTHITDNMLTDTFGSRRYLSIIGVDKNNCIIKSTNGAYQNHKNDGGQDDGAPIKIAGNSYIANLTIICTDEDTTYSEGLDLLDYHRSYCIHLDAATEEKNILEVHNCNLINDHWSCLGIGFSSNADYEIRITDCDMYFNPSGKNTPNYIGAIFAHSNSKIDGGLLSVRNCKIHAVNNPSVWFTENGGHKFTYEFINNAIVEGRDGSTNIQASIVKSDFSYGNSKAYLNN